MPLLEAVRARNSQELSGDLATGRGRLGYPNRYTVDPALDRALFRPRDLRASSAAGVHGSVLGRVRLPVHGLHVEQPVPGQHLPTLASRHGAHDAAHRHPDLRHGERQDPAGRYVRRERQLRDPAGNAISGRSRSANQLQRHDRGGRLQAPTAQSQEGLGLDAGPASAAPRDAQPIRPCSTGALPGLHAPVVLLRPPRRDDQRRVRGALGAGQEKYWHRRGSPTAGRAKRIRG